MATEMIEKLAEQANNEISSTKREEKKGRAMNDLKKRRGRIYL
jgi:hypothetical protein